MRYLLAASAVALLLTACATQQQTTQKYWNMWGMRPIEEAVSQYGPPHRTFENPDGSKVYEWTNTGSTRGTAQTWQGMTSASVYTQSCTIRLTTGPTGVIKYAAWQGNSC